MNNKLDFETALEILENTPFGDVMKFEGAALFVAEAFDISIDSLYEILDERG